MTTTELKRIEMLRNTDAVATLAVKDLGVAARFYEGTLSGDIKVTWFKDPDGNILSVVNR